METVFLLWHVLALNGNDEELLIGVYDSEIQANAAITRLKGKRGFADNPDGFLIDPYEMNLDHWTEGFIEN